MIRRVLMIGGANYTDKVVYSHARHLEKYSEYRCSALGVGDGQGHPGYVDSTFFENLYPFPVPDTSPSTFVGKACLVRDVLSSFLPSNRRGNLPLATEELTWRNKLYKQMQMQRYAHDLPKLIQEYDLCQWHCFAPDRLAALAFFPLGSKVVLAVWGSDLFRTSGVDSYHIQLQACHRADRIVVNSLEMREVFLAKFGRSFFSKIRMATIGCDMFDVFDQVQSDRESFCDQHRFPSDKIVVCVGNNSSPSNQHIEIIKKLGELGDQYRDRLVVIFPMTYGAEDLYLTDVRQAAERSRIEFRMLTEFQSDEEVAQLRYCTDIMIHLPFSDAFSAAIAETVYAGGVLITGAWLPYGFMQRRGIHFHDLEDLSELNSKLSFVLDNFEVERKIAIANAPQMRNLKAWDQVIAGWDRIYDELL